LCDKRKVILFLCWMKILPLPAIGCSWCFSELDQK
jgi:hypothetical protein